MTGSLPPLIRLLPPVPLRRGAPRPAGGTASAVPPDGSLTGAGPGPRPGADRRGATTRRRVAAVVVIMVAAAGVAVAYRASGWHPGSLAGHRHPGAGPGSTPWWRRYAELELATVAALAVAVAGWAYRQHRVSSMMAATASFEAARARTVEDATAPRPVAERPTTRFSDIAGAEEAVADLAEIVAWLKTPERYARMGVTLPRGALLSGPPGTGKTLLARAVAGEAEVAFFSATGSDFDNRYVGTGSDAVRKLFRQARQQQPAIVFIDEIDTVGRRRDASTHEERNATLNALLAEVDGFEAKDAQVVLIAATNRPDILDPALTRPGRLERHVHMGLPDRKGRLGILAVHARRRPLGPSVDLAALASRTPGMSGAQLERVLNEACMEAVRRDLDAVDAGCLEAGLATVAMGRARHSAVVSESDRITTAWHEAGHVVAAMVTPGAAPPVAVSILPRGQAGGVTWMSGNDDQYLSRSAAHAELTVLLGGRAAEELLHGDDFTSGAANDLERATRLAVAMITRYGMTELGLVVRHPELPTGNDAAVTAKAEALLGEARRAAAEGITAHRRLFDAVVADLLERESLDEADLAAIRERVGPPLTAAAG